MGRKLNEYFKPIKVILNKIQIIHIGSFNKFKLFMILTQPNFRFINKTSDEEWVHNYETLLALFLIQRSSNGFDKTPKELHPSCNIILKSYS